MSDIPSELRNGTAWWMSDRDIRYAAADEIERLRAQNAKLREALEQLLDEQNGPPLIRDAEDWQAAVDAARAALEEK